VDRLAVDPPPPGVKKFQGEPDLFRLRSGNYRIIYSIKDVRLMVLVIRIGRRREVYRGLWPFRLAATHGECTTEAQRSRSADPDKKCGSTNSKTAWPGIGIFLCDLCASVLKP